jgi:hypothetical protein
MVLSAAWPKTVLASSAIRLIAGLTRERSIHRKGMTILVVDFFPFDHQDRRVQRARRHSPPGVITLQ